MDAVVIVGIVFGGIVLALAVIGGVILMAIKIRQERLSSAKKQEADEARVIQEIYQGLSRMEARTEALETILLDRAGKDEKKK